MRPRIPGGRVQRRDGDHLMRSRPPVKERRPRLGDFGATPIDTHRPRHDASAVPETRQAVGADFERGRDVRSLVAVSVVTLRPTSSMTDGPVQPCAAFGLRYDTHRLTRPARAPVAARFPRARSPPITGACVTDSRPSAGFADPPPGARVGRYVLVERLGQGGEGQVYRARDPELDRDVALKSPLVDETAAADHAHLLKEARAASRLSHPGIVPIHEIFQDQGRPWIAMELVDGVTLRALLDQRESIPIESVVRYGEMLADALSAAHGKHVLHGDVTPGNILITPAGRLMLTDFGLARSLRPAGESASQAPTTSVDTGRIAGTLGYIAPEQMLGRPPGPQADIFSAGAVLYQMATGRAAFGGTGLGEVLDATLNREPPPLSKYVEAPAELERIVRKALAKRLDERYASAADMLIDLRALRRKLESGQRDLPAPPRRPVWPLMAASAAGLGVVALGWLALRPAALPEARPEQVTTAPGWEAEPSISPDGSLIAYSAEGPDGNVDLWLVDVHGGDPLRLTDDPAPDGKPAWYPDGGTIAFVSERSGQPQVWKVPKLRGPPSLVMEQADDPAISPDGTRIAFKRYGAAGFTRIAVAPLADPASVRVLTSDRDGLWDHGTPAWSPDGRWIAYSGHRDLWLVPADGGSATRLTTDGQSDVEPAWAPDGKFLYFSSFREGTSSLWRVPARGGAPARLTLGSGPERHPSVSGDGARLAYSSYFTNDNLVVRDLQTGAEYEFGSERKEGSPAFLPDRSAVVYTSDQVAGRFDLWKQPLSPEGRPIGPPLRLTDHPGSAAHPTVSPDGRWVAYFRVLDGHRDIWTVPLTGGPPTRITNDGSINTLPEWSPDGRHIMYLSERAGSTAIMLMPVAQGAAAGPARTLIRGAFDHAVWSPDSKMVAYLDTSTARGSDLWIVDAAGAGAPRQVTRGAEGARLAWSRPANLVLVSGNWGSGQMILRAVDVDTGRTTAIEPSLFGRHGTRGEMALSGDGRFLCAVRQVPRGDVWVLHAVRGHY
jgi:Tol biopolymer transport system component/serine/threonine protein kinase